MPFEMSGRKTRSTKKKRVITTSHSVCDHHNKDIDIHIDKTRICKENKKSERQRQSGQYSKAQENNPVENKIK
jgi:hypothetical protein